MLIDDGFNSSNQQDIANNNGNEANEKPSP